MLARNFSIISFECDGCSEILETGTGKFGEAKGMMDRAGWKSVELGKVWQHYCPACVPEMRERGVL